MKKSKYEKWKDKYYENYYSDTPEVKDAWNAACLSVLGLIRYRDNIFKGDWQHEDISYLKEDILKMIEK